MKKVRDMIKRNKGCYIGKSITCIYLAVLIVTLCGCSTLYDLSMSEPEIVDVEGVYKHKKAKLYFPENVLFFDRTDVVYYDRRGKNVSVTYLSNHLYRPMIITVYVYPFDKLPTLGIPPKGTEDMDEDRMLFSHYDAKVNEVKMMYKKVEVIKEDGIKLIRGGKEYKGARAVMIYDDSIGGKRSRLLSELLVFKIRDWVVAYRATGPIQLYKTAASDVDKFVQLVPMFKKP